MIQMQIADFTLHLRVALVSAGAGGMRNEHPEGSKAA
jgi:hypothetical protein